MSTRPTPRDPAPAVAATDDVPNRAAVARGIATPSSSPSSMSVCGRTEPSRWQCSSAFGSRTSSSRGTGVTSSNSVIGR